MSNALFPTLAGLGWSVIKAPKFNTRVQQSVSGRELRAALAAYPVYRFSLTYEVLRAAQATPDLQTLMGFFMQRQGSFDNFLFDDPTDDNVTNQSIGTGNGTQSQFQLLRAYGGFTEPVMNVNAITGVYVNGTAVPPGAGAGGYTISSTGLITFGTAPLAGQTVTWTGSYYYRCRFTNDTSDFENFMYLLWQLKKCELIGSLGVKI